MTSPPALIHAPDGAPVGAVLESTEALRGTLRERRPVPEPASQSGCHDDRRPPCKRQVAGSSPASGSISVPRVATRVGPQQVVQRQATRVGEPAGLALPVSGSPAVENGLHPAWGLERPERPTSERAVEPMNGALARPELISRPTSSALLSVAGESACPRLVASCDPEAGIEDAPRGVAIVDLLEFGQENGVVVNDPRLQILVEFLHPAIMLTQVLGDLPCKRGARARRPLR